MEKHHSQTKLEDKTPQQVAAEEAAAKSAPKEKSVPKPPAKPEKK
jgi:hypothetical protein